MFDQMRKGLRRWAAGGLILREIRGVRLELARIAEALEESNRLRWPQAPMGAQQVGRTVQDEDPVRVSYVTDEFSAHLAAIELQLTGALGQPPTEDQVIEEYERQHGRIDG